VAGHDGAQVEVDFNNRGLSGGDPLADGIVQTAERPELYGWGNEDV
jgi:hypothetical protein